MGQKKRIGIIIAAIIVVLLAAGVIGFFLWQQSPSSAPVSEDQTSSAVSSLEPAQAVSESETGSGASSPAESEAVVSEPVQTPPTVEEIQLTTYQVSLTVGQRQMPIVTMLPAQAPDKGEIWTSSDPSVATVSELGSIYGVAEGSCTVTVTSSANPAVSAQVAVTVSPAPASAQPTEETPTSSATSSGSGLVYYIQSLYGDYYYHQNDDGTISLRYFDGREEIVSRETFEEMEESSKPFPPPYVIR
ncbi:MAG TPA: Ig domain-containing protein [Candidatus Egerieicola faecale]|uniref:Ig domain-containing protein n=1 Tax=Candidatus Egerieicola faecale TaxID=2840774 RepID=A0A9D1IQ43_9FIRM|nr:Ig domain-containing protein [Candidatus Egerieicola faecale]